MLFTELTRVKETGVVWYLQTLPIQCFIQLTFSWLPLLKLIALTPRSSQKIKTTMSNTIPTNIRPEDTHHRFSLSQIPSNQSLVPSSGINYMLIFRIPVKLSTIDSVRMTIMRSIRFFKFTDLLSLNLIINPNNWLTSSSHQFRSITIVVQTIELFVNCPWIILDSRQQFSWI